MPLADILHVHIRQELSSNDHDISLISVRRRHLWDDSMTQFLKRTFDPRKPIRVIFLGEEAVDGGGPCREYFRLLCSNMRERSVHSSPMSTSSISGPVYLCFGSAVIIFWD